MGWIERIYWVSAIGGAGLFILRLLMSLFGLGDAADDVPVDLPSDSPDATDLAGSDFSFRLVSLQGLTGFFTMFGLIGLTLLEFGVHELWTIAGGFVAGILTLIAISLIFTQAGRLQSDGTQDLKNAIGMTGSVYLRIHGDGTGQVQVPVQGSMRILDAISENGEPLKTGARVRVVGVKDPQTVIVVQF